MNNINNINLNLLVTLDAIIREKSLTMAARKLYTSQPNISQQLKQLRAIFNDEIIIRSPGNRMLLTDKAKEITIPLNSALNQLSNILKLSNSFNPMDSKYTFTIGMSNYASIMTMSLISRRLKDFSSSIKLEVTSTAEQADITKMLCKQIDFAIGRSTCNTRNILSQELFSSELVCLGIKKHPIFLKKSLDVDTFFSYPHIQTVICKDFLRQYTEQINSINKNNGRIIEQIPHITAALCSLKYNNFLCITHKNIAEKYSMEFELAYRPLPFKIPTTVYYLYWDVKKDRSPAHIWLKNTIIECFKN